MHKLLLLHTNECTCITVMSRDVTLCPWLYMPTVHILHFCHKLTFEINSATNFVHTKLKSFYF